MKDTLLHQIQGEAVNSSSDLPSLLRKCRILAQRLGNLEFKSWVIQELEGYSTLEGLPDYRILNRAILLGHYFGSFGTEVKNVQIPMSAIDEPYRNQIVRFDFTQGVRVLEVQIDNATKGSLKVAVPPEALAVIRNPNIREDMELGSVVKVINTSFIQGILDTVRNRVLNFTLELESEAGIAGDPLADLRERKAEKVQQIFNTEIRGNVANFAAGSSNVQQAFEVGKGDREALAEALSEIGLDSHGVAELVEAASEEEPKQDGSFGKKVAVLTGKAFTKAGEGLLKVPASVAGNLISTALKGYYGISQG